MVELVTRMMDLKKQQARAPKKQSPSAKQLLDQRGNQGQPPVSMRAKDIGPRPQAFPIDDRRTR